VVGTEEEPTRERALVDHGAVAFGKIPSSAGTLLPEE